MKTKVLIAISLFCFILALSFVSGAQTKILDSNVDWGSHTLTVYLSDSGNVTSVEVSLGTTLEASDVYHQTLEVGSGITPSGDQMSATLSGVTAGSYYLDLKVTLADATVKEMQYQTPNQ